jgi:probable selenium-dependent hydroxylase accessory protein YqeC
VSGLLGLLRIGRGDVVAVAGAGGKTTLVYRLAAEARTFGLRVVVTTTTHMGTLPEATTGRVFVEAEGDREPGLEEALAAGGLVTLLGRRVRPDKLEGVSAERVDALARRADLVLVEADGARGRSLKVPADHEPVVPRSTTLLLVVAALDVLGHPLAEAHVHRVELVAAAAGRAPGSPVDEEVIVAALSHPAGYPSRVPPGARAAVFLNKAEDEAALAVAARIAPRLVPPYLFVAAGSARAGSARLLS